MTESELRGMRIGQIEEREQCCRDVCFHCRDLEEYELVRMGNDWVHIQSGNVRMCDARLIRERAYQQEQEAR